jgi:hypothetical protein
MSKEQEINITAIREIFPLFELTREGLEKAVSHLMKK